jgi:cupin 2 domain-containing protein
MIASSSNNSARSDNILGELPDATSGEIFETIVERGGVRIERIVSHGQATPEGEWYDQEWDEWVLVLCGRAGLLIEGEAEPRLLGPGDYVDLPVQCRHRVAWTAPDGPTVWLAVHWNEVPRKDNP